MNIERKIIALHLQELLELVKNEDSNISEIRYLTRNKWWTRPDIEEILARLRHIERRLDTLQLGRCALVEGGRDESVMHLITGLEGCPREVHKQVTRWLSGARQLTFVDPYFFSFSGPNKIFRTQTQYIESITALLPRALESLEIFHLPGPNRAIFSAFQKHCHGKNISLKNWETTEVHDRVLIKSESEARAMGTSFGGLGNKIAFMLDLPPEDLKVFRGELHRIKTAA